MALHSGSGFENSFINPDVGSREVLEVGLWGSSKTPGNTLHPVSMTAPMRDWAKQR